MAIQVNGISVRIFFVVLISLVILATAAKTAVLKVKFGEVETTQVASSKNHWPNIALETLAEYQSLFGSKKLFRSFHKKTEKKKRVITVSDLAREFSFIGVVQQGDELEAIMKSRRTRQTSFVRVGSRLGKLQIEEVNSAFVEVSYEGSKHQIRIE